MKKTLTIILLFFAINQIWSQKQTYAIETIAFYNVENLFDHYDDPNTRDDDRTPESKSERKCVLARKRVNLFFRYNKQTSIPLSSGDSKCAIP